ncbi:MAG: restriction endonuclease subunit S [Acidimicrobiales bacterium]
MIVKARLGDVARILKGTQPTNTVDKPSGPRFFGVAEISADGGGPVRYTAKDADLARAVLLQDGDVAIALLGGRGHVALVGSGQAGAVLGRECAVLRVVDSNRLVPAWLYAWVTSQEFRTAALATARGATMPRLNVRALEELEVALPSREAQQETAALIARFDSAISATLSALTELKDLRRIEIDIAVAEVTDRQP